MKFREKLNEYMERLSCSAKDLCTLSGISAASFSRYKNGERVPEMGTVPFDKLCGAIAEIAGQRKVPDITPDSVKEAFIASAVASFVSREMGTAQGIYAVAELIGCEPEKIYDLSVRYSKTRGWHLSRFPQPANPHSRGSVGHGVQRE